VRQTDPEEGDNELVELHDSGKGIRAGFQEFRRTRTLDSEMYWIVLFLRI
jgi:hypothetical protein